MVWQLCRALFSLGIGQYMARHFMTSSGISVWISHGAIVLMFLGGLANVLVVVLNRGMMPVRIDQVGYCRDVGDRSRFWNHRLVDIS